MPPVPRSAPVEAATRHALGWLLLTCIIGLGMAVLLVAPGLGRYLAPLTYGRWAPVHLQASLYGWCALPLVALLFRYYAAPAGAVVAVQAWSAALVFACLRWLGGETSGKLFMEWTGPSRLLFPLALAGLAVTLGLALRAGWPGWDRRGRAARAVLWLVLMPVPAALAWAASPSLFPPVNPDSGGATGTSLLGSTLVLVALFAASPRLLGVAPCATGPRPLRGLAPLLGLHAAAFACLAHGDVSHAAPGQVIGLFSLWLWPPLLVRHLRAFDWPAAARAWLPAFGAWGVFLFVSGCLMFLPGVLDRAKFTNAFVAHTHAAMAGMVSAFLLVTLATLLGPAGADVLARRSTRWIWNAGVLLHVAATGAAGRLEAWQPDILFSHDTRILALYVLRLISGLMMLHAAAAWWRGMCRATSDPGVAS